MDLLSTGNFVGAGSFCCRSCGYVLTLSGLDTLTDCPGCGGTDFVRASLFSARAELRRTGHRAPRRHALRAGARPIATRSWRAPASRSSSRASTCASRRAASRAPVALTREWTRIGRSLAADVRFDDPTVSRRHALIVRQPDGVRVLDDRSLNGVFVNGERIEGKVLDDGDEIIVGRYRLSFLVVAPERSAPPGPPVRARCTAPADPAPPPRAGPLARRVARGHVVSRRQWLTRSPCSRRRAARARRPPCAP